MGRLLSIQELQALVPFNASSEAEVLACLDSVCTTFESATRRDWLRQVEKEYEIRVDGELTIFPRLYPIEEVHEILEWNLGEEPIEVSDTEYDVSLKDGIIERKTNWKSRVKITITGGYLLADIPSDIKNAIGIEVRRRLHRDQANRVALNTEAVANSGSTSFVPQENWHPDFRRACNRYRRCGA